jgi:hypothetical protein
MVASIASRVIAAGPVRTGLRPSKSSPSSAWAAASATAIAGSAIWQFRLRVSVGGQPPTPPQGACASPVLRSPGQTCLTDLANQLLDAGQADAVSLGQYRLAHASAIGRHQSIDLSRSQTLVQRARPVRLLDGAGLDATWPIGAFNRRSNASRMATTRANVFE